MLAEVMRLDSSKAEKRVLFNGRFRDSETARLRNGNEEISTSVIPKFTPPVSGVLPKIISCLLPIKPRNGAGRLTIQKAHALSRRFDGESPY